MKFTKLLFLFFVMMAVTAGADVLYQNVPFYAGMLGYHTFRIPDLQIAPDGTLLAFADARKNSKADNGDVDVALRRSFDGGETWQPLQVIWDDDVNTCGGTVSVVDASNGRIWLWMQHSYGDDTQSEISDGTSVDVVTFWSCYSDDNGATWSTPVNRSSAVQDAGTQWDQTGPGTGIQLKEGSHAGRLVIPCNGRNIQSDDHGATWYQSTDLPSGTGEATVVELLYGVLKRNDRADGNGAYASYNRRIVCYSYNQGSSWTAMQVQNDLVCSICQASSIQAKDSSGNRIYLFSNPAAVTRTNMTVKVSYDNCYNWTKSKVIYPNSSAYSSLCAISNGSYGLLYENGDDGYCYDRITFAKFSYNWLLDSSLFLWYFEEYSSGETIPAEVNAVEDIRGYGFDGTPTTALTAVSGDEGHCGLTAVNFTGSGSQGIKITDYNSRDILDFNSSNNFTIRVVFRTSAHSSGEANGSGILIAKDVNSDTAAWWLRVQDGKIRFFVDDSNNSGSAYSTVTVSDGDWHEVIAYHSADAGTMGVIVDGQASTPISYSMTGSYANDGDICIGSFNDGSKAFIGDIDKIQIYRTIPQNILTVLDGDLNCDAVVDFSDLVILMENWLVYE